MGILSEFIDELDLTDDTVKQLVRIECKESKEKELIYLIERVGRYWGEDEKFLQQFIVDTLSNWQHDLDTALECFRGHNANIPSTYDLDKS